MHLNTAAVLFIFVGTSGIVLRRAYARHYLRTLAMTRSLGTGSMSQRRAEAFSVVLGIVVLFFGIAALLYPE